MHAMRSMYDAHNQESLQEPHVTTEPEGETVQRIRAQEHRLRDAMLAGNVAELDALIDDRLLFVGPDGGVYSKAE
jgi:Domain of unknown function (DUF4440)